MTASEVSYPCLYDNDDASADAGVNSASPEPPAPATAPEPAPPSAEERQRRLRHASLCALCLKSMIGAHSEAGPFRVQLVCKHDVCRVCAQKCVKRPEAAICVHCAESDAVLASERGVDDWSAPPMFSSSRHTQRDACVDELKRLLARAYANWQDYDGLIEGTHLPDDEIYALLGDTGVGQALKQVASKVSGLLTTLKSVAWREREQTVWSALDEAAEERERDAERAPAPRGAAFVDEMERRGRTLDDVFASMRYTLAHVYLAGARTVDDLRRLGFDETRHLQRNMRCVAPVVLLADRFDYTAAHDMRHLSNYELAACALHKCEARAVGLTAAELVQRGATVRDVRRFALSLDDWVQYADMALPQALALGFDAASMALAFPACAKPSPQTPGRALYVALCVARSEDPLTFDQVQAAAAGAAGQRNARKSAAKKARRKHKK